MNKLQTLQVIGLVVAIAGFTCIIISIFQQGSNLLLNIGQICTVITLIIIIIINLNQRKSKN